MDFFKQAIGTIANAAQQHQQQQGNDNNDDGNRQYQSQSSNQQAYQQQQEQGQSAYQAPPPQPQAHTNPQHQNDGFTLPPQVLVIIDKYVDSKCIRLENRSITS